MTHDSNAASSLPTRSLPWKLILPGILVLCLAGFIISQVVGVFYAIILPPVPPLPDGVSLQRHRNTDYGVDQWTYTTPQDSCEVADFYQQSGGSCQISGSLCGGDGDAEAGEDLILAGDVAFCWADTRFSIFIMRWKARISHSPTRISLDREVFWTSDVPPVSQRD